MRPFLLDALRGRSFVADVSLRFRCTEAEYVEAVRAYYARTLHLKFDVLFAFALMIGSTLAWQYLEHSVMFIVGTIVGALFLLLIFAAWFVIPKFRFKNELKLK